MPAGTIWTGDKKFLRIDRANPSGREFTTIQTEAAYLRGRWRVGSAGTTDLIRAGHYSCMSRQASSFQLSGSVLFRRDAPPRPSICVYSLARLETCCGHIHILACIASKSAFPSVIANSLNFVAILWKPKQWIFQKSAIPNRREKNGENQRPR